MLRLAPTELLKPGRWPGAVLGVSLSLSLSAAGCNDDPITGPPDTVDKTGAVSGRICSPDGNAWLSDARVYAHVLDNYGELVGSRTTYTDLDGGFVLTGLTEGPAITLYVQKGTWQTTLETEVKRGTLTRLPDPPCLDPFGLNAAVVQGEYDELARNLEALGVTNYAVIDGTDTDALRAFLEVPEALLGFDLITLEGGVVEGALLDDPTLLAAVQDYVRAGGTLFATDWAYDWVERAFPDALDFWGDDAQQDAAQVGTALMLSEARVVDQSLAGYLGAQSVHLSFDLAFWPVVELPANGVTVHVSSDVAVYNEQGEEVAVPGVPLLVSFSAGYGTVIYASFRGVANQGADNDALLQYMLYQL